jgi:hypothetical protein
MKVTIFYSWQSDLPNNTNRGLIERALHKAVESIKAEAEMVIVPCVERDVQGETGTPDIAHAIFRKIDQCRIFVGDVSIINPTTTTDRKTPNPNVLLELGYAAKTLTWDYVVCVYNMAFGSVKDLPFDLQTRLMCTYSATEEQATKSEERDKLTTKLKATLLPMLRRITDKVVEETTPKPLTPDAASAKVKEYLADDSHRIQLHDLVMTQSNELAQKIVGPEFPAQIRSPQIVDAIKQRLQRFEEISQVALTIMVAGCYHGTQAHEKLWIDLIERVANPGDNQGGSVVLLNMRLYPALLLSYGGGMAAVASGHYGTLFGLLTKPKVTDHHGGQQPLLSGLSDYYVIEKDVVNEVMGRQKYAPLSERFFQLLREHFRVLIHNNRNYQRCFDRFEYMRSLLEVDVTGDVRTVGCYGWRWKFPEEDVRKEIEAEERQAAERWPPYQASWFNGQRDRFMAAKKRVDEVIAGLRWN